MIQWVIKYSGGLVKDEKQASYVILATIGVILLVTIVISLSIFRGPSKPAGEVEENFYENPNLPPTISQ